MALSESSLEEPSRDTGTVRYMMPFYGTTGHLSSRPAGRNPTPMVQPRSTPPPSPLPRFLRGHERAPRECPVRASGPGVAVDDGGVHTPARGEQGSWTRNGPLGVSVVGKGKIGRANLNTRSRGS